MKSILRRTVVLLLSALKSSPFMACIMNWIIGFSLPHTHTQKDLLFFWLAEREKSGLNISCCCFRRTKLSFYFFFKANINKKESKRKKKTITLIKWYINANNCMPNQPRILYSSILRPVTMSLHLSASVHLLFFTKLPATARTRISHITNGRSMSRP